MFFQFYIKLKPTSVVQVMEVEIANAEFCFTETLPCRVAKIPAGLQNESGDLRGQGMKSILPSNIK